MNNNIKLSFDTRAEIKLCNSKSKQIDKRRKEILEFLAMDTYEFKLGILKLENDIKE